MPNPFEPSSNTVDYEFEGRGIWMVESKSQDMNGFLAFSYESC
jgi:hypothetical protein